MEDGISTQKQLEHKQQRQDGRTRRSNSLLLAKAYFFLSGASGVFFFPTLMMWLSGRGFSSAEIGVLAAIRPLIVAPLSLAATAFADRHRLHARLLLLSLVGATMLRAMLPLARSAAALKLLLYMSEAVGAPVGVMGDSIVLSNCQEGGYGRQRLWASLGFCMCSLPASWLAARFGADSAFVAFGVLSLPLLFVCMSMRYRYSTSAPGKTKGPTQQQPTQQHSTADGSSEQQQCHTQQGYSDANVPEVAVSGVRPQPGIPRLLLQPAMLLFLWRCALLGFGVGIIGSFEFLYLKQLGAPESLIGMALLISCATEVPAFQLESILQRKVSVPIMITIALLATSLRLAYIATLPVLGSPWAVLPVELLQGVTFACGWGAATVQAGRLAPQGLEATVQGMMQAAYLGVGAGAGGLVGGILMEQHGGQALFARASLLVLVGWAVAQLAEQAMQQRSTAAKRRAM